MTTSPCRRDKGKLARAAHEELRPWYRGCIESSRYKELSMHWTILGMAAVAAASLSGVKSSSTITVREPGALRCHVEPQFMAGPLLSAGRPIEPKSSGRVEELFVKSGARINRGDRIARLRGRGSFDLVAPFAGTVVDTCVSPGELSGPGRPLIRLAPPNQPLVR
jgi:biotin carboxyl carrier protein